jgi:long-chain acyl-CoA synthetase
MNAGELPAVRWGTDIVVGTVNGYPCRMFADRPRSMAELLVDARRWADRPYLVQGARRVSGAGHSQAVARVAADLRVRGVKLGDQAMLIGFNQIEWWVAFWALQCIGATVSLGNAWWSPQELADAVALVKPSVVVGHAALPPSAQAAHAPRLCLLLSDIRALAEKKEDVALQVDPVDEESIAVVIFSSGTTGAARGVAMSHRSVIANIQNLMAMTGRLPSQLDPSQPGTVSLVTMPLFHLGGFQISIMNLLAGGKVVFLEGKFEPVETLRLMQEEKVRAWGSVPTMVSRVIQHPSFKDFDTSTVSSIQMGGAPIPHELREQIGHCFPNSRKRVGSMYGLTEAGGVLAAGSGSEVQGRPGCVGRPLSSVEVRIDNPNPEGVGEVLARTPTATRGYLGDPKPLCNAQGWLATGDLGRFDEQGLLYIVGRSKDMIIRGGENIASVHVERCLRTHPEVAEVAVVALPHPDLGEEVGAAVVLRPGAKVTAEALSLYAATQLAKFEVPSRWWLTTDPLPTNATGKVIKREVIARWPGTA